MGTILSMWRITGLYRAIGYATIAVLAASTGIACGASPQEPLRISLEPAYFEGHFGSTHQFSVYDLPLSVVYRRARLRIHIELPYVAIAGSGRITGGTVLRGSHNAQRRSGVGDLWIGTQYQVSDAAGIRPSVSPFVKIKIPLASRHNRLGTGKADVELGARLEWRLDNRIFPYLSLGYRINGRARGLHLQNALTYQIGTTLALPDQTYVTAVFIGHGAFQRHVGATNSLVLAYNVNLNRVWGFEAYFDHGLSRNSPAIGVGLGVTAGF